MPRPDRSNDKLYDQGVFGAKQDLYTPSLGRQGLLTIERRNGFPGPGPFDFDPHPTNLGHAFIAREFAKVWRSLEP